MSRRGRMSAEPAELLPALGRRLARWRGGRLLHPRGVSFRATVELFGPFARHVLPGAPGRYAATARISRGVPTPEGWPDVLGLALRLHGPAGPVDLLVSSAGRLPVLRHLPLPRFDLGGPYTSILSYRLGGRRVYLAALPERPLGRTLDGVVRLAARGEAAVRLAVASAVGRWLPFGRVILDAQLSAAADAALAFDPTGNHPPELRTVGLIQRLRTITYAGSRHARGADEPPHQPGHGRQCSGERQRSSDDSPVHAATGQGRRDDGHPGATGRR